MKEITKAPSTAKQEALKKYGEDGIYELKIRDNKTDATLFYLINAIDKDVRAEACREILKRALTDIYHGLNETELVKQKDLVDYINKMGGSAPSKQWLFTTGASIEAPTVSNDEKPYDNNITNETVTEPKTQNIEEVTENMTATNNKEVVEENNNEDLTDIKEEYNNEYDSETENNNDMHHNPTTNNTDNLMESGSGIVVDDDFDEDNSSFFM